MPEQNDKEILDALQGMKCAITDARRGLDAGGEFARYYERLPPDVAGRLTEIKADEVGAVSKGREKLKGIATDEAFEQVIRAANVYRERMGYGPLGPDGWPEKGGPDA